MIVISGLEPKQYQITAEGMEELQQQLEELKQRRKDVAGEMHEISSQTTDLGALEDSTMTINQNQATEIDGQITLLERIIGKAEIITKPASNDVVLIGSVVTVERDGKEQTFTIVGPVEADPLEGKLSNESPFGQSLVGCKVGDRVEMLTPSEQRTSAVVTRIE
jgi:transcription elongation factor GreA